MKVLTEQDVLRVMREEWKKIVDGVLESAGIDTGANAPELSPELKVIHKSSGIRYTIDSVGPRDCILRMPEGEKFIVDAETLEKEYKLD